jgi:decaprenyl-phosphate phosphoribosyltransferase
MTATDSTMPASAEPTNGANLEPEPGSGRDGLALGLLKLARPKQWAKNILVFAAPGAAGVLDFGDLDKVFDAVVAFVCFCLAAAGTYYINDARDVTADRLHPRKRYRPIANGTVPVTLAFVLGGLLIVSSVAASFLASPRLALTVAAYVAMTTAYSTWLKHIAVVDLVVVAAGFVLRMVGGAEATGVPISDWAFVVTIFGSLFMVSGKRGAEAAEMGEGAPNYTAYLRSVSSGAMMVAYCLWALDEANKSSASLPWYQASILPFIMVVLRYALILDQGKGSAPEDIVLGDRTLQVIGLGWAVVFAIGVYTA